MRVLATALMALVGVAGVGMSSPSFAENRALVIGIDDYPKILLGGVSGLRNLRGAVSDANNMQAALVEHFDVAADEVHLLTDAAATREAILSEFQTWLIDGTQAGDRVIFYFAGHGAQVEDESGDEGDDRFDEVLAPHDVAGELEGADAGLTGFITDDEMEELLGKLGGREVLMIVDACHSGTITRGALDVRRTNATNVAGQGFPGRQQDEYSGVRTLTPNGPVAVSGDLESLGTREAHRSGTRLIAVVGTDEETHGTIESQLAAWTAVASAQLAVEDLELGGSEGLFTNRFVKGLATLEADLNGNGKVTASELLAYLRTEAEEYCQNFACGAGGLTPTLEAYTGYDSEVLAEGTATYTETTTTETPAYSEPTTGETYVSTDTLPEQDYYGETGKVTVKLSDDGHSTLYQPIHITVHSEVAGELVILDVRDDGTTVQLFPNTPSLSVNSVTKIEANADRLLPGEHDPYELVPDTAGTGRIVALVIDPNVPIRGVTDKYLDLAPIPSPEEYIAELSRQINRTVEYPTGSEEALEQAAYAVSLAYGEIKYEIK